MDNDAQTVLERKKCFKNCQITICNAKEYENDPSIIPFDFHGRKRIGTFYINTARDIFIQDIFNIEFPPGCICVCSHPLCHHVSVPQGLKYRRSMAGKTAVFNGEEVILEETDWYLLDLFRLWWRYGISFIRLQMWVEEIMEKFMRWVRNIIDLLAV